jgi:hypothetical protein
MKKKKTTSAAHQGWWVQSGSRGRWVEAGAQAGRKQMAMAIRPVLTPFGRATPVSRAAKADQQEAKAASVPAALAKWAARSRYSEPVRLSVSGMAAAAIGSEAA